MHETVAFRARPPGEGYHRLAQHFRARYRLSLDMWVDENLPASVRAPVHPLSKAPGARLIELAQFLLSSGAVTTLIEPAIADLRKEYFDDLHAGHIWRSRCTRARHTLAFYAAILEHVTSKVWKAIGAFKAE